VGSERDTGDGYRVRKVADTGDRNRDWRPLHVVVWEQRHGPVPAGYRVAFRDGDRRNVTIDNLVLRTAREMIAANSIHNLPPDIAAGYRAIGVLRRVIRRKEEDLAKSC